jgi:hypothetical protein
MDISKRLAELARMKAEGQLSDESFESLTKLAIEEANKHTDVALKHLEELEANTAKKNSLKEFALHLLNREV